MNSVLLDNQAQASIFGNAKLLEDIVDCEPHRFNGMGGGSVIATQTGSFCGIPSIHYSPNSNVNILSWSQMVQSGALVSYDVTHNQFKMSIKNETLVFKHVNGLYALTFSSQVYMTRDEQSQARMAVELQRRLAYPARSGVQHFLKSGAMSDVPIGSKAIELIDESIEHMQGKWTRKSPNYGFEVAGRTNVEKKTNVHADLMFVKPTIMKKGSTAPEKINFIISVSDFGLTIIKAIKSKGLGEVSNGIADILRIYRHHAWKFVSFRSDGEYNFENSFELLVDAPPHIPRGSGNHDGRFEERVRRIKDNIRAIQAGLPFHM